MKKLEQQLTERANRDADCDRMRLYYKWQRLKLTHPHLNDPNNNDDYWLSIYNELWNTSKATTTNKPLEESKAYCIVKVTENIASSQIKERARKHIVENAEDTVSWEFLQHYTSSRHRPRNVPPLFSSKRRNYRSKKSNLASSVISHQKEVSETFLPTTELVQLTIPVLFRHGAPYSSFEDMTSSFSCSSSYPSSSSSTSSSPPPMF